MILNVKFQNNSISKIQLIFLHRFYNNIYDLKQKIIFFQQLSKKVEVH